MPDLAQFAHLRRAPAEHREKMIGVAAAHARPATDPLPAASGARPALSIVPNAPDQAPFSGQPA